MLGAIGTSFTNRTRQISIRTGIIWPENSANLLKNQNTIPTPSKLYSLIQGVVLAMHSGLWFKLLDCQLSRSSAVTFHKKPSILSKKMNSGKKSTLMPKRATWSTKRFLSHCTQHSFHSQFLFSLRFAQNSTKMQPARSIISLHQVLSSTSETMASMTSPN